MNFLFPLYLLAAGAVLIPVLLHLRRRPPQDVVPFSAMMFLETAPVPPVKRRRPEDLLLLALRCLALILLALMFSRPLLQGRDRTAPAARSWVVLLDESASMRREEVRGGTAAALDAALAPVRETDEVTLVAYDHEPRLVTDAGAWRAIPEGQRKAWLRGQALARDPGWGGSDLGRALVFAAGLLDSSGGGPSKATSAKTVLLVSDLQEGSSLEALGSFVWPQNVNVAPSVVRSANPDNLSLSLAARLGEDEGDASGTGPASAAVPGTRVRVSNAAGSRLRKFKLAWQEQPGEPVEGEVLPGGSRIVLAPPHPKDRDGVLELSGDTVSFDNRVYQAGFGRRVVPVLLVADLLSRADPASPQFFLSRALTPGGGMEPVVTGKTPGELSAADLARCEILVLAGKLPSAMVPSLKDWLAKGNTMLWSLSPGEDAKSLAALAGAGGATITEAPAGGYAMLGEIHFEHPWLKTFADSGVRDFSKIRFWKHRVLKFAEGAAAREIASFDDRSPAIVELPVGRGRAIILASGWTAGESQLALSSKFVPLLYALFDYAGLNGANDTGWVVGDRIPLEPAERVAALAVTGPDGRRLSWNGLEQSEFAMTSEPGIYVLGEGAKARHVAVNLPVSEGRTAAMNPARLRDAGVRLAGESGAGVSAGTVDSAIAVEDFEKEQRQKLWKIIAATALVVLLLETWVAGLGRRTAATSATA